MERIDQAFEKFKAIRAEIAEYSATVITEADTRLKIIDRLCSEILGYNLSDIFTEQPAGKTFLDYRINVDGFARLIIEAKRDDISFGLDKHLSGRAYKLNGAVFSDKSIKEGIVQAIGYCAMKNAELACVTNGREWVIFRANRLGDGTDTLDGKAFIFTSIEQIENHFALFYQLLAKENLTTFLFRACFQEAEGFAIAHSTFSKFLRDPDSKRVLPSSPLAADIDRVMSSFFRRLSGDDDAELLAKCFVVTRESEIADKKLARLSEDLLTRVRTMETDKADALADIISRVKSSQRNEFVLLVGTKGAGKTTFIDRFFRMVLKPELAAECRIARINLADSDGSEKTVLEWLDNVLAEELEKAVFENGIAAYSELQGIYYDQYQRWKKGSQSYLYERDKNAFKEKFGDFVEDQRRNQRHDYIKRLVRDISLNRKKIPCIIFDNADHFTIEFQERVFQYARSIYETSMCLVIMPITDRTSWQLSREGALRSFENESLFLPTPSNRVILTKRIEFLQELLDKEKPDETQRYFVGRGITLSLENMRGFVGVLQGVFISTGKVARWIGNLANNDIRRSLEVAKSLMTSPHLEIETLISSYVANSTIHIPPFKILKALIKGLYDVYPYGMHIYVRNAYSLTEKLPGSPLTGLRILIMLLEASGASEDDPYISIDQATNYLSVLGIDAAVTQAWLKPMLEFGLCHSYDPTLIKISDVQKIEITPAGRQHLLWANSDTDYMQAMLEATPIHNQSYFEQLSELRERDRATWFKQLSLFVDYLLSEDSKYCSIPNHQNFSNQTMLAHFISSPVQRLGKSLGIQ